MTLQAIWVHGQSTVADLSYDDKGNFLVSPVNSGSADGSSYSGQADARAWFHFPLATPVIHNGIRIRLIQVFVLFRSDPDVLLTEVHVWDGARRIEAFSAGTGVSGLHDGSRGVSDCVTNVTRWVVGQRPQIFWGVCLSAHVHFKAGGSITFTTAGADFEF